MAQQTVADILANITGFGHLSESGKLTAEHKTDYTWPLYNVWKFQSKTPGVSHFGNSEITILDNLLAKYTKPFDGVVDPFVKETGIFEPCYKFLTVYKGPGKCFAF